MDAFRALLPGRSAQASGAQGENTSLLADWAAYSGSKDVEGGNIGPSTSAAAPQALLNTVDKAGTQVSDFMKGAFTTISKGVQSGVSSLPSTEALSIPSSQQLMYFFALLAGGIVFLLLAFLFFLPVIILSPSKFALSFTLGCMLILAGFAQLRGWQQQLKHMLSRERLPFSSAYLGSIVATLYAALIMKSYLLSLFCSGLQVVALLYYLMSYFPGGTQGVKFVLGIFWQAVTSCFGQVQKLILN